MDFEVLYSTPDESTASFAGSQAYDVLDDDQQMLIDIEQNIANLERTISNTPHDSWHGTSGRGSKTLKRGSSLNIPDKSAALERDRKRSSTLKSVKNLMRLGKQRPPREDEEDESASLIQVTPNESGKNSRYASESESAPISRANSECSLNSNDSQMSVGLTEKGRKAPR